MLQQIAEGNALAFKEFFELYKNRIFVFVEQLIHSRADAEEIVQDTFMKVWQTAPRLVEIDNPGQYIYAIARNKTLNYIRKIASDQRLIDQVWANQADFDTAFSDGIE